MKWKGISLYLAIAATAMAGNPYWELTHKFNNTLPAPPPPAHHHHRHHHTPPPPPPPPAPQPPAASHAHHHPAPPHQFPSAPTPPSYPPPAFNPAFGIPGYDPQIQSLAMRQFKEAEAKAKKAQYEREKAEYERQKAEYERQQAEAEKRELLEREQLKKDNEQLKTDFRNGIQERKNQAEHLEQRFYDLKPSPGVEFEATEAGTELMSHLVKQLTLESQDMNGDYNISLLKTDRFYSESQNRLTAFDRMYEMGAALFDIALGLNPVTAFGQSTYELLVGKNLVTGEKLASWERGLAFAGIISGGTTPCVGKIVRYVQGVLTRGYHAISAHKADKVIKIGKLINSAGDLVKGGWAKNHKIINVHEAEAINREFIEGGWIAPYEVGTRVVEFVTKEETKWVRVHGANNQVGSWVVKKDALHGLSPEQIRHKYALPNESIFVSDVHVPQGTVMHRGHVNYIQWDETMLPIHPEGAVQYQLKARIPASSFKNTREIGEVFNE